MASVTRLPLRFSDGRTVPMPPELIELVQRTSAASKDTTSTHKRYLHASMTTQESAQQALHESLPAYEGSSEPLPANYNAAELDAHIRQRIQTTALDALKLIEDIINGRIPASIALRAKYASIHLARAGYGPITRTTSVSEHLTREDIEAIKQRCNEASANNARQE